MAKKIGMVLLVFVFLGSAFFMGCTKKQVSQDTTGGPAATPAAQPAPQTGSTPQSAPATQPAGKPGQQAQPATPTATPAQPGTTAPSVALFDKAPVYFDYDEAELKPEALKSLEKKAEWLRNNPQYVLGIEGHCDERGTNEYNLALGDRRAHTAKNFLNTLGIDKNRIHPTSYGEERPVNPGHNEEAWTKNRRAEFYLVK